MFARRRLGFVALCLMAVVTSACVWSTIAVKYGGAEEDTGFAELIRDTVPAGAEVRWVRRQAGRVLFYGDLVIPRFAEPLELLEKLRNERRNLKAVVSTVGQMLDERLREDTPVWIIMRRDDYSTLTSNMKTPVTVVASAMLAERDMVIVTNSVRPEQAAAALDPTDAYDGSETLP